MPRFPSAAAPCFAAPDRSDAKPDGAELIALCEALLSGRGEASGTAMAREVLDRYHDLDETEQLAFFETLARKFGPDREKLAQAIESWRAQPNDADASDLHFASEPRRQELIRRLNRAPGGTSELVSMRADLLRAMNGHKDLAALDRDVVHLLSSWFNRGFLVLRRIDWSTPANILEQIIRYEAVHEIRDWNDLRRRIDPDRPALLRVLSSRHGRRALDLRRGGADGIDPRRDRAAARRRPAAGAGRARPHRGVLFDLQHPARPRRNFLRQLPDQAGGRGIAPRIAEAGEFRDAVAGAGLHAMAEAGERCPRHRRGPGAARASR